MVFHLYLFIICELFHDKLTALLALLSPLLIVSSLWGLIEKGVKTYKFLKNLFLKNRR